MPSPTSCSSLTQCLMDLVWHAQWFPLSRRQRLPKDQEEIEVTTHPLPPQILTLSFTFVRGTLQFSLPSLPLIHKASHIPFAPSFDFSLGMLHPGPSCQIWPLIGSPFRKRQMRQRDRITYPIKLNSCFSQELAFW